MLTGLDEGRRRSSCSSQDSPIRSLPQSCSSARGLIIVSVPLDYTRKEDTMMIDTGRLDSKYAAGPIMRRPTRTDKDERENQESKRIIDNQDALATL
eukprot:scaffold105105_cov62-Attheya_sp.AAC.4